MYKKDLLLTDSKRNRFSLIYEFSHPLAMCEEMLHCDNADEVRAVVNRYATFKAYSWEIVSDEASYTKLKHIDCFGNVKYLFAYKTVLSKLADFSDDELVIELIKRGYKVSKYEVYYVSRRLGV